MVECQFQSTVQAFQSDWGGEFRPLVSHLASKGIHFQHPCPYIHPQNGRIERKHQHVTDMGLTLLAQSALPFPFWWDAVKTATFLINRLPTPTLNHLSPYKALFHTSPTYTSLKPFGCACFPYLKPYNSYKLQFRSTKCIFLGYSDNHKGYVCMNHQGRVYISDTVEFNEQDFPYPSLFPSSSSISPSPSSHCPLPILPLPLPPPHSDLSSSNSSSSSSHTSTDSHHSHSTSPTASQSTHSSAASHSNSAHSNTSPNSAPSPSPPPSPPHHNTHSMVTRSKRGIFKPKSYIITHLQTVPSLPKSDEEALSHEGWLAAMEKEFLALKNKDTWVLIPPSPSYKVISNKWVYRVKILTDGSLDQLKARLVARGFEQMAGVDFTETFSPVVKHSTIRLVFALAATKGWSVQQIDINNAFLNGDLEEPIYMSQPNGFEDANHPDWVCKLQRSLHGLKQAPKAWYEKLKGSLVGLGFNRSSSVFSLFFRRKNGSLLLVLVYVDDILIT